MNARQAAKAAAKRIEDLEITLDRAQSDIKRYNQCIDGIISGRSPCDWCEDKTECNLAAKGKGCDLWMLSYKEDETIESERILPTGISSGAEAEDAAGKIEAF